jgi:hypothetical protein
MADELSVRRILQIRMRSASADSEQLLPLVQATMPFYQAMGGTRLRFLRNVDDRSQFVLEIDYQAPEAIEAGRHNVASHPMVQNLVQAWRMVLAGAVEIDVYEDLTGESERK